VNVAGEMQRRGMTTRLLSGGATTSRQHTAVRVAPAYKGSTVHVLDASRVVGVAQSLLDPARAAGLDQANRADQQRLREQHESRHSQPLLGLDAARANRERLDFTARSAPLFTGVRPVAPPLADLRELIDWQFFFLAWELKGKFPAILENLPAARDLFDDANALLDEIIADERLTARGGYGLWPARADGDWYEPGAAPAIGDLHAERFRGIRPAFGYPAAPDHSLKGELFEMLGAGDFGMALTESFAMTPASSVSGLLFAHPASRYFTVGRIGRDQAEDYARRRRIPLRQ